MLKKNFEKLLEKYPFLNDWRTKLSIFTLPGFDKVPVFDVLLFLISEIKKDQIPTRARSISYSFFIAFFPAIIFLFTLLPYIPLAGVQQSLIEIISEIVPENVVQNFILVTIDDVLNKPRGALLSFVTLLTLYFSTQGMVSIIMSFNKTHAIYNKRNFFSLRWLALKLTVLLFVMFISSITLLIVGSQLINVLILMLNIKSSLTVFALNALRYIIILLLYFFSISTIYYYGPATKKKFRFISVGSTIATVASIAASLIFSYYVAGIDRYNTVYGFFGSIIMFLGWMYVNAFVLLVGFELNASIYYNRNLKYKLEEKNDEEDSVD